MVISRYLDGNIQKDAREACGAKCSVCAKSAIDLRQTRTTANLDRAGGSEELPTACLLAARNPAFKYTQPVSLLVFKCADLPYICLFPLYSLAE
jgi:hypothetical protein